MFALLSVAGFAPSFGQIDVGGEAWAVVSRSSDFVIPSGSLPVC